MNWNADKNISRWLFFITCWVETENKPFGQLHGLGASFQASLACYYDYLACPHPLKNQVLPFRKKICKFYRMIHHLKIDIFIQNLPTKLCNIWCEKIICLLEFCFNYYYFWFISKVFSKWDILINLVMCP